MIGLVIWGVRDRLFSAVSASASEVVVPYEPTPASQWINPEAGPSDGSNENSPQLGPRHQWTYQEWVTQLSREASAIASNPPEHLNILLGDSISLWFPHELLPIGPTWLNQGISGEGAQGLLNRLDLIDQTNPQVMYLMIGINDLLRDVDDETILANQRQIIQNLKVMHPSATIVVQTVLPHAGDRSTWEGKDQLLALTNQRIQNLNQRLAIIADEEGVDYLNLVSIFSDAEGNLRTDFTTDGLHLNDNGYRVWASALQMHQQLTLDR
ncbi:MAG: hypothetical protein F6K09_03780 [Merismopedia sp. SIO2A8]|nr:hypothetical protein [Merismopedia sp. SIO2A8]